MCRECDCVVGAFGEGAHGVGKEWSAQGEDVLVRVEGGGFAADREVGIGL